MFGYLTQKLKFDISFWFFYIVSVLLLFLVNFVLHNLLRRYHCGAMQKVIEQKFNKKQKRIETIAEELNLEGQNKVFGTKDQKNYKSEHN